MIIQIQGNVTYKITLDPSTWIFDDRKVELDKLNETTNNLDSINFSDSVEWNRAIIEGSTKPPTLETEKKYKSKKQELTEGTFVINLAPFLEYTEPKKGEDAIIHFENDKWDNVSVPYKDRESLYAYFCKSGKRLYEDGMFDLLQVKEQVETILPHVKNITFE